MRKIIAYPNFSAYGQFPNLSVNFANLIFKPFNQEESIMKKKKSLFWLSLLSLALAFAFVLSPVSNTVSVSASSVAFGKQFSQTDYIEVMNEPLVSVGTPS